MNYIYNPTRHGDNKTKWDKKWRDKEDQKIKKYIICKCFKYGYNRYSFYYRHSKQNKIKIEYKYINAIRW